MPCRERFAWHQFRYPEEMRLPTEAECSIADDLRVLLVEKVTLARVGKLHIFKPLLPSLDDENDIDVSQTSPVVEKSKAASADDINVSETDPALDISKSTPPVENHISETNDEMGEDEPSSNSLPSNMDSDTEEIFNSWKRRAGHLDEVTLEEFDEWQTDNTYKFGTVEVDINVGLLLEFFDEKKMKFVAATIEEHLSCQSRNELQPRIQRCSTRIGTNTCHMKGKIFDCFFVYC